MEDWNVICPTQENEEDSCYGIPLLGFVLCLAEVVDLVNRRLFEHHLKVAYLAFRLGEVLGFPEQSLRDLLIGGLLHDIGAFSLLERLDALHFEFRNPHHHAFVGYVLLKDFGPFASLAEVIRCHHLPWEEGRGRTAPLESHVIHFADRVSIVCSFQEDPLGEIREREPFFRSFVPRLFHPEVFEAFRKLLSKDYVWFDLASPRLRHIVHGLVPPGKLCLNVEDFLRFCRVIAHLVDFRSAFTATHSAGVAYTARRLGELTGLPRGEHELIFAAGLLHDLGKIAVPVEILEKPGPLTEKEIRVMKSHAYYTFAALSWIQNLKDVALWASEHHERCNGQGYPFGRTREELLFESRVMAVADVFVALSEDRPYRPALRPQRIREILGDMANLGGLDADVVAMLLDHFDEIHASCREVQEQSVLEYAAFRQETIRFTE
ncbi:HD-GYP domain-containing protein [Candidatus Caldatribacterium sp. SIUC1]|uniref:HD-GYP domain-containing protein n=1 Tax=Candidatus Caldatribacterium sp. SIUC1 TaxID=3418365 RepID=UPI003F694692